MSRRYVKVGERYTRLLVVEKMPNHITQAGKHKSRWKCMCDCGNSTIVDGSRLTMKDRPTRSCGCLQREQCAKLVSPKGQAARRLPDDERTLRFFYNALRNSKNAKKHGCTLTLEDYRNLIQWNCFYCGSYPELRRNEHRKIANYQHGVDRLDSSKGYHVDNVQTCCATCNRMKLAMSQEQFITKIWQIFQHSIFTISSSELDKVQNAR